MILNGGKVDWKQMGVELSERSRVGRSSLNEEDSEFGCFLQCYPD